MTERTKEQWEAIAKRRFADAIDIQYACNPNGVSKTIHDTCCALARTTNMGTMEIRLDPAVRLMVNKLADLCQAELSFDEYSRLSDECRKQIT